MTRTRQFIREAVLVATLALVIFSPGAMALLANR